MNIHRVLVTVTALAIASSICAAEPKKTDVKVLPPPPLQTTLSPTPVDSPLVMAAKTARAGKAKSKISITDKNLVRAFEGPSNTTESIAATSPRPNGTATTPAVYPGAPDPVSETEILRRRIQEERMVAEAKEREEAAARARELERRRTADAEDSGDPAAEDPDVNEAKVETIQPGQSPKK